MSVLNLRSARAAAQQPKWPRPELVDEIRHELRRRPALVTEQEVVDLAEALASAQRGRAFVVQAGDCAELFAEATPRLTRRKPAQLDESASTRCSRSRPTRRCTSS